MEPTIPHVFRGNDLAIDGNAIETTAAARTVPIAL
jgi:hypothetical protein